MAAGEKVSWIYLTKLPDFYLIKKEVGIMPFRDGTGPLGLGPMTGKGEGYCAIPLSGGYAAPVLGRRWFGPGYRRGYAYPITGQAFIPWTGYGWRRRGNYPVMNAQVPYVKI
jgi:hypothetical protein